MSNTNLSDTKSTKDRIESRVNPQNTAALAIGAGGAMQFSNMTDIMEFAKLMSVSGVAVPKHLREQPGACLAIVIQASEWQMSPYAVANKSYSVNDRMGYEAQLVAAVILRRAPIKTRISYTYTGDGDMRRCTTTVTTLDGEVISHTSPPVGLITPKNSPLWKSDLDQQLGYHTARSMARRHFPDVLLGVYTMDELQDAPMDARTTTGRVVTDNPMATAMTNPYIEEPKESEPEPQPEPAAAEPEPQAYPDDKAERDALVATIKADLKANDTTVAKFAPLCRDAGLLAAGVQLPDAPLQSLQEIADNVSDILLGQFVPVQ